MQLDPSRIVGFLIDRYLSGEDLFRLSETCRRFDDCRRRAIRTGTFKIGSKMVDHPKWRTEIRRCSVDNLNPETVDRLKSFQLTHLTFGNPFNESIDPLSSLTSLTHITFGERFNRSIDALGPLTFLTHLTFGYFFNRSIEALNGPTAMTSLTHLTFGAYFNQPIEALGSLTALTKLTFGRDFNQPIDPVGSLTSLTHLTFRWNFNQAIEPLSSLMALTHLTFGWTFNQPITKLPPSLTQLKIRHYQHHLVADEYRHLIVS